MFKKAMLFLGILLMASGFAYAEEKYTVSGEVVYQGSENICVCLHNQETWPNWKKELPPGRFTQIVKANPSGKTSFEFKEVPKGEYIIMLFVDENNNGKFDCNPEGWPKEPWSMYKRPTSMATSHNWYHQKFEVNRDITGIVMEFESMY